MVLETTVYKRVCIITETGSALRCRWVKMGTFAKAISAMV
jgi:hypothetical protein